MDNLRIPLEIKLQARDPNGMASTYTYHLADLRKLVEDGRLFLTTALTDGEGPDGVRCEVELKIPESI